MSKKTPVALLLNDIHVSKDNIPEFQKNLDEALQICKDQEIQELVIGGDMFHARASQTLDVLMAVRQAVIKATAAGLSVTIAEGNHDKVDQESLLGYSHLFSEYPNVFVVDEYIILYLSDDVVLYVMGYFPENGSFTNRLESMISDEFDDSKYNILYIHEGINGALATPNEKELPTHIFQDFDRVLVGHYHNRCKVKDTNIEYIGSSRQHNFGEDESKGYTVIYSDGSHEFVMNQANIRYMNLEAIPSQIDAGFMETLNDLKESGKYKVKLRINCDSQDKVSIDKQQLIEAGATKVEIVTDVATTTTTAAHSLEKKFDKAGIKAEYLNFCADKGILNADMGIKYLEKIN